MRISSFALTSVLTTALAQQQWPIHDNGLNEVVEWDHYSLIVNGERLYMWSGEIHYWRLPVPELWRDVLEKVKVGPNTDIWAWIVRDFTKTLTGRRFQHFQHLRKLGLAFSSRWRARL